MIEPTSHPLDWFSSPTLTGDHIRLEPLSLRHDAGYFEAAISGPDIFTWTTISTPTTVHGAQDQILAALLAQNNKSRLPLAIVKAHSGQFIGTTSFYDLAPQFRALAIGHTWLGQPFWGLGYNTEAKLLMLTHAFEVLGALRIVWHVDSRNERSLAAVAKLGATREGELRKHRRRADGSWRTTVQFSATDDDWPAMRNLLSRKLPGMGV